VEDKPGVVGYTSGFHTTTHKAMSSCPRRHFVNNEKYIYEKLADLVECNITRNHHITKYPRRSNCCV